MNSNKLSAFNLKLYVSLFCIHCLFSSGDKGVLIDIEKQNIPKVIINEILFRVSSDYPEFVEFYNGFASILELKDFYIQIGDGKLRSLDNIGGLSTSKTYFIMTPNKDLLLERYPTVTDEQVIDEKLPALRDGGNKITLYYKQDETKMIVLDEVNYLPDWHLDNLANDRNISLEKINPFKDSNASNWSSCLDREKFATPAKQNSIFLESDITDDLVFEYSEVVSPNGDGHQEDFWILIKSPDLRTRVNIEILNSSGLRVYELSRNQPIVFEEKLLWSNISELENGHYFVKLSIVSDSGLSHSEFKPFAIVR